MSQSTHAYSGETSASEEEKASPHVSAPPLSLSGFLRTLFRLLDENQVCYCVLHSWEELPESLPNDLDIAMSPKDWGKLPIVFQALVDQGYKAIQYRRHGGGVRFDFAWFDAQGMHAVGVDVADQDRQQGLIIMSGLKLVARRRRFNGFWVSDAVVEFTHLLAKKSLKGTLPEYQAERLAALVHEIGSDRAKDIAADLFGKRWKDRVVEACQSETLASLLSVLKKRLWLTRIGHDPLNPVRLFLYNIPRLIVRSLRPVGLFLVILGPDGAGKSTLVGRLVESFADAAFNRFRVFHWRPNIILPQPDSVPCTDPHDEPPRGTLGSLGALSLVFLDYWLGFVFVVRPLLARAGLVIFDRYYHDLLIDRVRYRYGGPMWLARFLGRFVPPPDMLFLVLDADDAVILSRKREVPPEELRRQRESYQLFSQGTECATLIRTDLGIERTAEEASRFVVEYLAQRFQRRYGVWIKGRAWKSELRING